MQTFAFVLSIFLLLNGSGWAEESKSIRDFDFRTYLIVREHLAEGLCEGMGEPIRHIEIQFADLLKNGREQALVEATSCAMGNGGADIVEVFQLDASGKPVSLTINDSGYKKEDLYRGQYRTPRLEVSNGKLIRWFDVRAPGNRNRETDEETTRVITYRWSGKEFVIQDVQDVKDHPPEKTK